MASSHSNIPLYMWRASVDRTKRSPPPRRRNGGGALIRTSKNDELIAWSYVVQVVSAVLHSKDGWVQ
jgi:hypothetical protein